MDAKNEAARAAANLAVTRAGGSTIKAFRLLRDEGQSDPAVLEELIILMVREVAVERPDLKDDFPALMDECRRRVRSESAKLRRPQ